MSEIYNTLLPILTGVAALAMTAAGYLLYRQKEIIALAKEVIISYEDKNISEEEYGKIVQKLKRVIYKV